MTLRIERVEDWLGRPLVGSDGEKLGKLDDLIFAGDGTPLFGLVSTGLFGRRTSLIPLAEATLTPDHVTVPYAKDQIKEAPQLDDSSGMTTEVEDASAEHYGLAPREKAETEEYVSAGERARQAEAARAAEERAAAMEARADQLAQAAEQAAHEARDAHERADQLAKEHGAAVTDAQQARQEQQALMPK